jgi:hypothetical protein
MNRLSIGEVVSECRQIMKSIFNLEAQDCSSIVVILCIIVSDRTPYGKGYEVAVV